MALSDLQKMVVGMFSPGQAPANASIYDLARADAQRQALAQLGMGLVGAAVPQTPTMRAQALQQAFGSMGNMGTNIYNSAQARLMMKQLEQAEAEGARDAAFNARLETLGGIPPVGTPMTPAPAAAPPVTDTGFSSVPSAPVSLNPAAATLVAPPPPSAAPASSGPQYNELGLTQRQTSALMRLPPSQRQAAYKTMIMENAKSDSTEVASAAEPIYASDGKTIVGYRQFDAKGNLNIENVPVDPAADAAAKLQQTFFGEAAKAYYSPTNGYLTASNAAADNLAALEAARGYLTDGIISGTGSLMRERAALLADTLGLPQEALTNTQSFRAALGNTILNRMKMLGGNDSEKELIAVKEFIGANTESLTNDAIQNILQQEINFNKRKYEEGRNFGINNVKLPSEMQLAPVQERFPNLFDKDGKLIPVSTQAEPAQTQAKNPLDDLSVEQLLQLREQELRKMQKPQVPMGN